MANMEDAALNSDGVVNLRVDNTNRSRRPRTAKGRLFYLILYGVLSLTVLVAVCLWVFFHLLNSSTRTTPGLEFHPKVPESSLIWFKVPYMESYKPWVEELDKFLEVYRSPGLNSGSENIVNCDYDRFPVKGQVCHVDVKNWFPCTRENNFNFHRSSPCVFVNLHRIVNWMPDFYNNTADLPDDMPTYLKHYIGTQKEINEKLLNTVWVSCEGENPADKENIGPIKYYPRLGFPGYYFPFQNIEGYLSPLIAIHFERPTDGVLINVECKAWARNLKHDPHEQVGMVHFELLID